MNLQACRIVASGLGLFLAVGVAAFADDDDPKSGKRRLDKPAAQRDQQKPVPKQGALDGSGQKIKSLDPKAAQKVAKLKEKFGGDAANAKRKSADHSAGKDPAPRKGGKEKDQNPSAMSPRQVNKMIQFAPLVCGETRVIHKDGTVTTHEIMCTPPTTGAGNTGGGTKEGGEESSGDGSQSGDGGDKSSGKEGGGSTSSERRQKHVNPKGLPKGFQLVNSSAQTANHDAEFAVRKKTPGRQGSKQKGVVDNPLDENDAPKDTKFGPRVLSAKGGSDRGDWEYLGSYEQDGERVEVWGDPKFLGPAFGWVDGQPPPDLKNDPPKTKKNGRPKRGGSERPKDK